MIPGQSQANYAGLSTITEATRPKIYNTSSRRAWIDTSHIRTVIGLKKMIEITSLNTTTVEKGWLYMDGIGYVSWEVQWEVPQLWQIGT